MYVPLSRSVDLPKFRSVDTVSVGYLVDDSGKPVRLIHAWAGGKIVATVPLPPDDAITLGKVLVNLDACEVRS